MPTGFDGYRTWQPFYAETTDASVTGFFEDDEPHADGNAATHYIGINPSWGTSVIKLTKVMFNMDPTNAVTYNLYLLTDNPAAALEEQLCLLYQSEPLRADAIPYMETGNTTKLPVQGRLSTIAWVYFKLDWTGAPGVTTGQIRIEGLVLV